MIVSTPEYGLTIILRAMGFISGLMEESTAELGRTVSYMAKECTNGLMAGSMMASMWMTRSKVMEHISGLMGDSTRVTGMMANSMEKASSQTARGSVR
jgi:hypothetical protein